MIEPTGYIAAFLKVAWSILPGVIGASIALKFLGEDLSRWQKITSFLTGLACAVYVAPIIIELMTISSAKTQSGIEFLVGLFALAACRELFREINEADIIGTIKRRYFGPKP